VPCGINKFLFFCDERAIFSRKGCEGFWDKGVKGFISGRAMNSPA